MSDMNVILRPLRNFLRKNPRNRQALESKTRGKRLDYELLKMRKMGQNIIVQAAK